MNKEQNRHSLVPKVNSSRQEITEKDNFLSVFDSTRNLIHGYSGYKQYDKVTVGESLLLQRIPLMRYLNPFVEHKVPCLGLSATATLFQFKTCFQTEHQEALPRTLHVHILITCNWEELLSAMTSPGFIIIFLTLFTGRSGCFPLQHTASPRSEIGQNLARVDGPNYSVLSQPVLNCDLQIFHNSGKGPLKFNGKYFISYLHQFLLSSVPFLRSSPSKVLLKAA
jgi:hypothetical protein